MVLKLKITPIGYEYYKDGYMVDIIITLENYSFQGYYWFIDDINMVKVEPNFLKIFKVDNIEEIPFYNEFIKEIKASIPNEEKIKEIINVNR